MAKKIFTNESLITFIDEIKAYITNAVSSKSDLNHSHAISEVTGLQNALETSQQSLDALTEVVDGKAEKNHSHAISDITNLQSTLDSKANANAVAYIDENDNETVTLSVDLDELSNLIGGNV